MKNHLQTDFASPERDSPEKLLAISERLREQVLLPWFDGLPVSVLVINSHRQIVFCNEAFCQLARKKNMQSLVGLRPGEALSCIYSQINPGGCGCSTFCRVCGAAKAIIKSLEGSAACEKCRMIRRLDGAEVPLDIQTFTKPITFEDENFTLFSAMDITHELRLKYLENTFYHGMINSAGGISSIMSLLEMEPGDTSLIPMLNDCASRILRDVLYHRDVSAAEQKGLEVKMESFEAAPYLQKLLEEECAIRNMQPTMINTEFANVTMYSDKRILGHVVRNMFVNALEADTRCSKPIRFTCVREDDGRIAVSMKNCGIIPDDIQKQLFRRYVSTKGMERGLGTYVMKMMAEQSLGGEVSFTSANDTTEFTVRIPSEG